VILRPNWFITLRDITYVDALESIMKLWNKSLTIEVMKKGLRLPFCLPWFMDYKTVGKYLLPSSMNNVFNLSLFLGSLANSIIGANTFKFDSTWSSQRSFLTLHSLKVFLCLTLWWLLWFSFTLFLRDPFVEFGFHGWGGMDCFFF